MARASQYEIDFRHYSLKLEEAKKRGNKDEINFFEKKLKELKK